MIFRTNVNYQDPGFVSLKVSLILWEDSLKNILFHFFPLLYLKIYVFFLPYLLNNRFLDIKKYFSLHFTRILGMSLMFLHASVEMYEELGHFPL